MINTEIERGNDIVFRTLAMIKLMYNVLKKPEDNADSFFEKVKFFQKIESIDKQNFHEVWRDSLLQLLVDADIPLMKENVFKIKHPDIDLMNADPNQIAICNLIDLTDVELVKYFGLYCRTVTYVEKDNLLLLKYSPVIYETGWNRLALMCRGKVIDLETWKIVTYPFDKFFNLNEVESTKEDRIRDLISKAEHIYISDKKDGTLIAISNYQEKPLITTTGAFENIYIDLATKLLQKNHPYIYSHFPKGFTYLFELIAPETHQCVQYNGDRRLILIGIRRHDTMELLQRSDMEQIAAMHNLNITEQENLSLDEMLSRVGDKDVNKEGWVIRIKSKNKPEQMVKLKYNEYFMLHCIHSGISPKRFYNFYVFENIDERLGHMTKGAQEAALSMIEQININRSKIEEAAITLAKECCNDLGIDIEKEIDREEQFTVHKHLSSIIGKRAALCPLAIKYIRTKSLKYAFFNLRYEKYIAMVEALAQEDHRG